MRWAGEVRMRVDGWVGLKCDLWEKERERVDSVRICHVNGMASQLLPVICRADSKGNEKANVNQRYPCPNQSIPEPPSENNRIDPIASFQVNVIWQSFNQRVGWAYIGAVEMKSVLTHRVELCLQPANKPKTERLWIHNSHCCPTTERRCSKLPREM
jgi:hypothetical protein